MTIYFSHNMGPFKLVDGQKYTYIICEREAYRCGASFIKPLFTYFKNNDFSLLILN